MAADPAGARGRRRPCGSLGEAPGRGGDSERLSSGRGASPSEPDENGDAPLHVAVRLGRGDILSLLLRRGGAFDALDNKGRSPLLLAARRAEKDAGAGSLEIVRRLVDGGADLSLRFGDEGFSALELAARSGRVDAM